MFKFRRIYELTEKLGMQPELLYPRRSRFAPKYKLSLCLKAVSSPVKYLKNFTGQAKLELV